MQIPKILLKKADELELKMKKIYPSLAPLAKQCFLNTIETTATVLDDGTYFVITGDIPALWLRDSAAQLKPYIKYAGEDDDLKKFIKEVIEKHTFYVNLDPYSNAFNSAPKEAHTSDKTDFYNEYIWERKYEVDSLCASLYLAHEYFEATDDREIFTDEFKKMIETIVSVFKKEQNHDSESTYFLKRDEDWIDGLAFDGKGRPTNFTGMTWSGFRPSDDACTFNYLVPSNMMAVVALGYGAELAQKGYDCTELSEKCLKLAREIDDGIQHYAIYNHPKYGKIYAYETDGYGNYVLMDDANSPSLLSIPYIGYKAADNTIYQNTRRFILSEDNPYYFVGKAAKGVGSPHTGKDKIWHIGLTMQILTSTDKDEINECLKMISETHAGTNFMHESFNKDNPEDFTRKWFAWANTLFAQMLQGLE